MKYSSACEKTPAVFSKDVFFSMRELFCFAVASAAMVCIFLHADHNPLDGVLSLCLTITNLYYYIPYGFAATARLSWELGMHKQLNDCYNVGNCRYGSFALSLSSHLSGSLEEVAGRILEPM
nr:protein detoxification 4 [Quercus suber]